MGTVLDAQQEAIIGGNTVLLTPKGKQVSGTTTNAQGQFQLRNLSLVATHYEYLM
ncbi:MAG: hypothetical protein SOW39_03655 [Porphyromonas sp.]|nr:hypothetical protein [Porphyromonas sp.]